MTTTTDDLLEDAVLAEYRSLPAAERRRIVRAASPEVRLRLAWVERQMAMDRSPGALAAVLTEGREKQAPHLDLIDGVFQRIAAGERLQVMLTMPPRHGKQVADSEPVLTTEGWKRHGDLREGDHVYAPTGRPVQVEWVSEPSEEKMRVTFSDGESVLVHPNHEWTVYDRSPRTWRTVETRYLATQKLHSGPQGRRGGRYRFQLPAVEALQNPDADLPMDPYTLGVWLGDGATGKASFCGTEEDVNHIAARIPYELGARWVHPNTGVHYQYIKGIRPPLRAAGVLDWKHIPQGYLVASERQRRDLLAGLVDTDGSLGRDGRIRFVSASEELARGVRDLARTLGYRANLAWRGPDTRERSIWGDHPLKGGSCWVTDWTPHDGLPQGTLPRKAIKHSVKTKRRIGVAKVEPAAPEPGRCIQVEGSLYLVGRALIPTHNSQRASRWGPLWYLRRHPTARVMLASYGADLADDHGRWVRDQLRQHSSTLGIRLDDGSRAANRFDLEAPRGSSVRGGMVTAGVGGSLTGKGFSLGVIDDPFKGSDDANSPAQRERVWNWYQSVFYTRRAPGASIVLINTRWHEDDLSGRILQTEPENWTLVDLPALALSETDPLGRQQGEALWPEQYDEAELARTHRAVGERVWWALYQQQPRPLEGGVWQWAWIMDNRVSPVAFRGVDLTRIVVAIDPSGGSGTANDETGVVASARSREDEYYVLADRSGRHGANAWGREACLVAIDLAADAFVVETNFGGDMTRQVLIQAWAELEREGRAKGMPMPRIVEVNAKQGKRLRAEPIAQLYEQGLVHHAAEFPELERQMVTWIPGVDSPDRMDALVHGLTELANPAAANAGTSAYADRRLSGRR
ncbi:terminase large subunit domain-containing protein [Streptomyces olivaceiscleroticus]|uniref:DOD-type homing endonuclease domain-containing protein n=1 Tax=Streptomyces olivaceiscleroticus TaxID=68245 RepID=A0ABN1BNT6_9ACTN